MNVTRICHYLKSKSACVGLTPYGLLRCLVRCVAGVTARDLKFLALWYTVNNNPRTLHTNTLLVHIYLYLLCMLLPCIMYARACVYLVCWYVRLYVRSCYYNLNKQHSRISVDISYSSDLTHMIPEPRTCSW